MSYWPVRRLNTWTVSQSPEPIGGLSGPTGRIDGDTGQACREQIGGTSSELEQTGCDSPSMQRHSQEAAAGDNTANNQAAERTPAQPAAFIAQGALRRRSS